MWYFEPPNSSSGRASSSNVVRVSDGKAHNIPHNIENPIDAARLFLTDEILKKILKSTNEEGERVRQEKQNRANNGVITYKPISKDELECYPDFFFKLYI